VTTTLVSLTSDITLVTISDLLSIDLIVRSAPSYAERMRALGSAAGAALELRGIAPAVIRQTQADRTKFIA